MALDILNMLKDFHISDKYAFLIDDTLVRLPVYFEAWNSLAALMPELVVNKHLLEKVHQMPLLDYTRLEGYRQYRLAHLQLSIIASGYVWQEGDRGVAKVLPKTLAIPWCGVSSYLGLQPVLCHASLMLANWKYSNENRTLQSLYRLPGGEEADWFITVTVQIELDFAAGLKNLMLTVKYAETDNLQALTECLIRAAETVSTMRRTLSTMHDKLTAETFYNKIRPFLTGWGGEGSPLPEGLIYEGVSDIPRKMTGGSAAQSSTLQCIDAVLGIQHSSEIQAFLSNMRHYMPPAHRQFLTVIEQNSRVKSVVEGCNCENLKRAYNNCVKAVEDFRSYHIQIVTKYIVLMANRDTRNKDYESLATRGTGGSSILPFLKNLRATTSASMVPDPATYQDTV